MFNSCLLHRALRRGHFVLAAIGVVACTAPGLVGATALPSLQQGGKLTSAACWIPDKVEEILGLKGGPFIRLANGHLLTTDKTNSCISEDEGKTWKEFPIFAEPEKFIIDLGGIGNHSGAIEATMEQLKDGRIWMLLRTNWGRFWEAFSDDEGTTWKNFNRTAIDSSSAPGCLERLQSGRLVLLWNRWYPEGKTEVPLRGGDGDWSEVPVSNHRQELSIMFSEDEGKSWSQSVVIARITTTGSVSYPRCFEASPGELWITAGSNPLRIKLHEKDFIVRREAARR